MTQAQPLTRTVTVRAGAQAAERARVRAVLLGMHSRYVVPVLAVEEDGDEVLVRYDVPATTSTLAVRLAGGSALSLGEAVRLAADVGWGLAAAAATGLAHGGLDASQVVLGDGPARLVGVGLAALAAGVDPAGEAVAPEVRAGGPPTAAADLWSLGVLLRDLTADAERPLRLDDLLERLTDVQPSRRPASARAVSSRLVGMRIAAPHVGPGERPTTPGRAAASVEPAAPIETAGAAAAPAPSAPAEASPPVELSPSGEATSPVPPVAGSDAAPPVDRPPGDAPTRVELPVPRAAPTAAVEPPTPSEPTAPPVELPDRRAARPHRRPRVLAASIAVLIAAGVLAVALVPGSGGAAHRPAAPPTAAVAATTAPPRSGASPTPRVPLPIVAATTPVDPAALAALRSLVLTPADVAPHARSLAVPEQSNFDAVLRALFAECDYFTPIGQAPLAHVFSGFVDGPVEVFDDLTTYTGGLPGQVAAGVATAVSKCPNIEVRSGNPSQAAAKFAVARVAPPRGVPADAVALTYRRTDVADLDVSAVFLTTGTTLRVVLALGPSFAATESDWDQAALHAWTRLGGHT